MGEDMAGLLETVGAILNGPALLKSFFGAISDGNLNGR
jgi:hypothetical protein